MDYAAIANTLMRRKLLEDMYDRMTDEEKRLFVQMAMQQRPDNDIRKAIEQQSSQLQDIRHHQQSFSEDFLSNILGNATWDGAVWLISRLARIL